MVVAAHPASEDPVPTLSLPIVNTCSVAGCAYNHDTDCHAGAITITGLSSACGTYVTSDQVAGNGHHAQVGACHRSECVHNAALECTASSVMIGPGADLADCLTYSAS